MAKKAKSDNLTTETDGSKTYALERAAAPSAHPILHSGDAFNAPGLEGFEQVSLPPIIKPKEMPDGGFVMGRVVNVIASPQDHIKSPLLLMQALVRDEKGEIVIDPRNKFAFPVTAVIGKALQTAFDLGDPDKKADQAELAEHFKAVEGSEIVIRNDGIKPGAKTDGKKQPPRLFTVLIRRNKK